MSSTNTVSVTVAHITKVSSTMSRSSIRSSVVAVPDPAVMPQMAIILRDITPSTPTTLAIR